MLCCSQGRSKFKQKRLISWSLTTGCSGGKGSHHPCMSTAAGPCSCLSPAHPQGTVGASCPQVRWWATMRSGFNQGGDRSPVSPLYCVDTGVTGGCSLLLEWELWLPTWPPQTHCSWVVALSLLGGVDIRAPYWSLECMTTVIPWVPRSLAGLPSSVPLSESFFF